MIYTNEQIPLVAEPFHRGRNDRECHRGHFCYAKAGVSRRNSVMPLRLLPNHQGLSILPIPIILLSSQKVGHSKLCQSGNVQWIRKVEGMTYTLHRYIDVPRFLTNLSREKMNIVKLFMRLNEFSSVRHINIARACLEEYMPCLQKVYK